MFTRWFECLRSWRILAIVTVVALIGPVMDWAVHSSVSRSHKKQLIEYVCRVAEPRLQAGAFREVQDFLISSTNMFGEYIPVITLEESGNKYQTGRAAENAEVFECEFSGRNDVRVRFAFLPYQLTPLQFGFSYTAALIALLAVVGVFFGALRSAQTFAADLFQSWLARELELETLGIEPPKAARPARWLSWIGVSSDLAKKISQHIGELERAIKAQASELAERRADSAVAAMAAQIAHDIRSPLSAINMALATLPDLPAEHRGLVTAAASRINTIAEDLLTKRKNIRNEAVSFNIVRVRIIEIVAPLIAEKRMEYRGRTDLEIISDLDSGEGVELNLDPAPLARALSNLINNAAEAIEGPGRIDIRVAKQSEYLELSVSDTGQGIPPEILTRLGQDGVTSGKDSMSSGFGLGVAHAKKTVEKLGGNFQIRSRVGEGTSVSMQFRI